MRSLKDLLKAAAVNASRVKDIYPESTYLPF